MKDCKRLRGWLSVNVIEKEDGVGREKKTLAERVRWGDYDIWRIKEKWNSIFFSFIIFPKSKFVKDLK